MELEHSDEYDNERRGDKEPRHHPTKDEFQEGDIWLIKPKLDQEISGGDIQQTDEASSDKPYGDFMVSNFVQRVDGESPNKEKKKTDSLRECEVKLHR